MLSMSNAETLIHEFMTSRLDYSNALLGGCSACLINKLQGPVAPAGCTPGCKTRLDVKCALSRA